jgi:DNA-binding transcriptional regulator LsrR (DeoR family)
MTKDKTTTKDLSKAATAARLKYCGEDGKQKTQQEIAALMGISQAEVARYLKLAREANIIRIEVDPYFTVDLRQKLMETFPHLTEVIIVPIAGIPEERSDLLLSELGTECAHYFRTTVRHDAKIGVSGGETMNAFIRSIGRFKDQGASLPVACHIFPLVILLTAEVIAITPAALVANFVSCLPDSRGKAFQLPSVMAEGRRHVSVADIYKKNPEIQALISEIEHLDYYFVGIGCIDYSGRARHIRNAREISTHLFSALIWDVNLLPTFQKYNAKGECLHQPFDENGNFLTDERELEPLRNFSLALPADTLCSHVEKQTANVVGVAGGLVKHEAVHAALRAKIFNVLITDSLTVEYVLKAEGRLTTDTTE